MYFDPKEFGKRLQDQRLANGMPQEELAQALGLASKQHVSRMERGISACSLDLLVIISETLHVSTDYLLMGKKTEKETKKEKLLALIGQMEETVKNM